MNFTFIKATYTVQCKTRSERIHKKPGRKEHADGQQDDCKVGEHSRVHRASVSRHSLEFLQQREIKKQVRPAINFLYYRRPAGKHCSTM